MRYGLVVKGRDTQGPCHCLREKFRTRERRQFDQPSPITALRNELSGNLERQSGLPYATRPHQGYQTVLLNEREHLCNLCLPADEARELHRQVVHVQVQSPQRREHLTETACFDLEQTV